MGLLLLLLLCYYYYYYKNNNNNYYYYHYYYYYCYCQGGLSFKGGADSERPLALYVKFETQQKVCFSLTLDSCP